MIKYVQTEVVFSEIPDEITLAVNISNCQNNCPGCHSAYLRQNIGEELTEIVVDELIEKNSGITCFCFMGEGNDAETLKKLIIYIKEKYPKIKLGLYSGREEIDEDFYWENLDYLKIGPYISDLGPLNKETTNQRLYMGGKYYSWAVTVGGKLRKGWKDITEKFWKKNLF
jgi:anaerobic ribonucleoside-triphosphate reductase activating protein